AHTGRYPLSRDKHTEFTGLLADGPASRLAGSVPRSPCARRRCGLGQPDRVRRHAATGRPSRRPRAERPAMKITFAEAKQSDKGLLAVFVTAGRKLGPTATALDRKTKGALARAAAAGSFS